MVMKNVKIALTVVAFSFCTLAAASVSDQMRAIGKSIGAAETSQTSEALTPELQKIRAAAEAAMKEALPAKVAGKPDDVVKDYQKGYTLLIEQADQAIGFSKAGKLDEAKALLAKMKDTRNEFHKKYR